MSRRLLAALGLAVAALAAPAPAPAAAQAAELVSPLGRPLFPRPDTGGVVARAESAAARWPVNVDTLIALGQAYASVWRYGAAVAAYSRALGVEPQRAVLYRHRGHRYISLRRFPEAVADLERAATLDSTSFDIWYHLGLAYYLSGRAGDAVRAYRRCLAAARDADDTVAVSDWLWLSLQRAGRGPEADAVLEPITDSLAVRENTGYHRRLLLYKGRRTEADLRAAMAQSDLDHATLGYGLATWVGVRGDTGRARALLREIVEGAYWPAFGFIAAEADLAATSRLRR